MTAPNSSTNGHHDHVVDELVAACLDEADRFTRAVVERVCAENPAEAEALRGRYDALRRSGLVAHGQLDGAAPDPWSDGARETLSDPDAAKQFDAIGPYQPLKELGRGGQAVVFLAEDVRLHRPVALKVLKGLGPLSETVMNRFKREAEVASKLDHPGICAVYDAGVKDAVPYIAMRFVEGETLGDRIEAAKARTGKTRRSVKPRDASSISVGSATKPEIHRLLETIEKAARALHIAHEAGIVHRDVKPGNIMVTPQGEPVLLDFGLAGDEDGGLATLTETGDMLGTPAYMSPEQLMAKRIRVDRRTDVYSLGVTLFECLTLDRPFSAKTRDAMYQAIQFKDPTDVRRLNPALPPDLKVIVETALEKDRDKRYQTAADFADDLRRLRTGEPISARPVSALGRAWRWAKRRPMRAMLAAALVIGVPALTALLGHVIANQPAVLEAERQARLDEIDRHLEAGYNELAHGDKKVALQSFDAALLMAPDSGEAIGGKALALYRVRDYEGCLAFLDQQGDVEGGEWALHRVRIDALRKLDRDGEAADLEKKTTAEPETALGFFLAGSQLMKGCQRHSDKDVFRRAHAYFRRAALTAPHARALYHLQLAHAASHLGEEAIGRPAAESLLALWPGSYRAIEWTARVFMDFDSEAAFATYERAVALKPRRVRNHITLARLHEDAGRADEAVAVLRKAVEANPRSIRAPFALVVVLVRRDAPDEAIAVARRSLASHPEEAVAHGSLAYALHHKGDLDRAVAAYEKALELDPDHASFRANLGLALHKRGENERALSEINRALDLDPKLHPGHSYRGQVLRAIGRPDEAIRALQKAIDIAVGATEKIEPYSHLGLALLDSKRAGEAVDAFQTAIDLDPHGGSAVDWNNLASGLANAGRRKKAIATFQKAIELDPELARAHHNFGLWLGRYGQWKDAVARLERAVELEPGESEFQEELGLALAMSRRFDAAIAALKRAVKLAPENHEHHCNLGYVLENAGRYEEAIVALNESIRLKRDNEVAWNNLGTARLRLGRVDAAAEAFHEAIQLKPDLGSAWNGLASARWQQGRLEDTIEAFRKALALAPRQPIYWNLGLALRDAARLDESAKAFRDAVEFEPNHSAYKNLGKALNDAGDLDGSVEAYKKSLKLSPRCWSCLNELGHVYRRKGQFANAIRCYTRALELNPKNDPMRGERAWIRTLRAETEKLLALEPQFDAIVAGEAEPADANEAVLLAKLVHFRRHYVAATRRWRDAFKRDATLATRVDTRYAFWAASAAARAGTGQGEDVADLDDAGRAALRREALRWLTELRTAFEAEMKNGTPSPAAVLGNLHYWTWVRYFAGIRDEAALAKLPADERAACKAFWAEVRALIDRTKTTKPAKK